MQTKNINDNSYKSTRFSRRSVLLWTFKISLLSILTGRLFYLQFLKHNEYKLLSEKNKLRVTMVNPLRGRIYDKNKVVLADNRQVHKLVIDKNNCENHKEILQRVVKLLSLSKEDLNHFYKKIKSSIGDATLIDELTWKQLSIIEENIYNLDGISITYGYSRHYPNPEVVSHIVGYVGYVSGSEALNKNAAELEIKSGKNGVEKSFDNLLKGKHGLKKYEVDAHGNVVQELSIEESKRGESISLSIDYNLQKIAYEKFGQDDGSAILMDIHTGSVDVICSSPGYDNNILSSKITKNNWKDIVDNPRLPLINKSISNLYVPGSVFKLVLYLAALEKGFDPNIIVNCGGGTRVGDRVFHCANIRGHGPLNMHEAIMKSCNCYAFEVSRYTGIENIANMARKLGLGEKTNIELPSELSGIVPDKEFAIKKGRTWQLGDTFNVCIGQGALQTTAIQLAQMMARITSRTKVSPSILLSNKVSEFPDLNIKPESLDHLLKGLGMVVNNPGGTAFYSKIPSKIQIGGKTSTVQVISKRKVGEDLSSANIDRQFRNHGVFLGYGPIENPKYCACVYVEHAGFTRKAVQIAHHLIEAACMRDKLLPN